MKKLFTGITILFVVLLMVGCNHEIEYKQQNIKFEDKGVTEVNQIYNTGNINFKIDSINFSKSSNDKNTINIFGEITTSKDGIFWSPENSTVIINNKENTSPKILNELNMPLNTMKDHKVELIINLNKIKVEEINDIRWHITQPVKNIDGLFISDGNDLDITFKLKQ